MKITYKRADLEIAYRPRDLRTVSSFITYCEEHGLKVSKDELEYYDEQSLLVPALFVDRGYAEMRKILRKSDNQWVTVYAQDLEKIDFEYTELDPQIYYSSIGLSMGNDDWLKHFRKDEMKIPAQQDYVSWDTFNSWKWEVTDPELVDNGWEPLYSIEQLYPIAFLTKKMQVSFKNEGLYRADEQWVEIGKQIKDFMNQLVDHFIQPRLYDYTKLINILVDIKELIVPINRQMYEVFSKQLAKHNDRDLASKEAIDERDFLIESKKAEAERILKKHNLTIEQLSEMRTMIMEAGTFDLDHHANKRREAYVKWIDDFDLESAEDPYRDVGFINVFLTMLGEKPLSVKQLLMKTSYSICQVCGGRYLPDRRGRKTCGLPSCLKEQKNRYKKHKRQQDPTYGR